jgi:hypothetical protein
VTGDRRYDDEEVRKIFDAAARPGETALSSGSPADGMTLAELKDIGAEVGLSPERIARAAATLEVAGTPAPRRKQLGLPVAVGHVVELPRAPTDHEWDLLVTQLRETFGAHGKVSRNGAIREWTNGNLHAYVEPTEHGHRLRLGTLNGRGVALNFGGVVFGSLTVATAVVFALSGGLADDPEALPSALIMFGAMAAAAMLTNVIRLPGWAGRREEQMRRVAARAVTLLSEPPASESHDPS